jgi:oxygen-dependent protoporphyrinogen oxidase
MDLLIPARRGGREETLAEFVIRRLGREALDQAAQPMIGGIYTADPRKLSLQATMPQFLEMEQKHGSILLAMWKARQAQGAAPKAGGRASGARYDLFLTLRGGLARLVESLVARLPAGSIRSGSTVESLERTGLRWTVRSGALGALEADAVCVSLPAGASSRLLTKADPPLAQDLAGIPYASVATVNLGFDRSQVRHALDGMGFVVPAVERRAIVAASFSSVKFAGRSPADRALLRAFVGGAMHPEALAMDDDTLVEAVMRDLRQYVGVQGAPRTVLVSRYESAMAQYCVGHLDRVARIEAHEAALPGLALAGNGYRGVGIGDCVASGERAARRLIDYLTDLDAARHNGARELAAAAR